MSAADDDDDYLSDKFLLQNEGTSKKPSTYSELRKEAQKRAHLKNEQNKKKSRRQVELESREAGLNKSLFERVKEEEEAGVSGSNKALSIMMKMGFKPGQSLGSRNEESSLNIKSASNSETSESGIATARRKDTGEVYDKSGDPIPEKENTSSSTTTTAAGAIYTTSHRSEPLPLQEWAGRKGIGLGVKRERSPGMAERMAKMARLEVKVDHRDFRDRVRDEYNNRRAEGRLGPAQLTCVTLDEKLDIQFNVLWLNPSNPDTFPSGLMDALTMHSSELVAQEKPGESIQDRLKKQMQKDALQPLDSVATTKGSNAGDGLGGKKISSTVAAEDDYSSDLLEEAAQFLRLQAQDRLDLVLSYLRDKHSYCFWCGVQYESSDELESQCPGTDESDHD